MYLYTFVITVVYENKDIYMYINIFRKVNDFHKTQIHHVILYSECNPQFSFFSLHLIFSYLYNFK